jgi:hypothetical protein
MGFKIEKFVPQDRIVYPENMYESIIANTTDEGKYSPYTGKEEPGMRIEFRIVGGEFDGKLAFQWFPTKLSPKSKLFRLCLAARKRNFTGPELAGINNSEDVANILIGLPVRLIIKNKVSKIGNPYYVVTDFISSDKIVTPPQVETPPQTAPEAPQTNHVTPVSDVPSTPPPQQEAADPTDNWAPTQVPEAQPE